MANIVVSPEVAQLRYYGMGSEKNVPLLTDGSEQDLWTGQNNNNLLAGFGPVIKLGIQTVPGTKFYLNGALNAPIIIDHTGVYELDLTNITTTITTLSFDASSLALIDELDNLNIIVDILYTPSEGTVNN